MIKKLLDIYSYINETNTLEKKLLLQTFYYKYLVIESKLNIKKEDSFLINNFDNFSKKSIILPKIYFNKKSVLGYSLSLINYKFQSIKTSEDDSFSLLVSFSDFRPSNILKAAVFSLLNKPNFLLFLSAVKGGYLVYSAAGIKGFLPRHQVKFLKVLKSSFLKHCLVKKFSLFWFRVNFTSFRVRLYKKSFRLKFRGRFPLVNLVFLIQKRHNKKILQRKNKKNVKHTSFKKKTRYFTKK